MKLIITTAIIAMFSAGVYGIIDISRDLENGTMVQYEQEEQDNNNTLTAAAYFTQAITEVQMKYAGQLIATNAVQVTPIETEEVVQETEPDETVSWKDLDVKIFSRAAPKRLAKREVIEADLVLLDNEIDENAITDETDSLAAGTVKAGTQESKQDE
jgi:hypothetical protein